MRRLFSHLTFSQAVTMHALTARLLGLRLSRLLVNWKVANAFHLLPEWRRLRRFCLHYIRALLLYRV